MPSIIRQPNTTWRNDNAFCYVQFSDTSQFMDIELLSRRQAVMAWRDRWFSQAVTLLNGAGIKARAAFDVSIADAGATETMWDADGFVLGHIDALMAQYLDDEISAFLKAAAEELACIDERFGDLGHALVEHHAAVMLPTVTSENVMKKPGVAEPALPAAGESRLPRPLQRLTGLVGDHALARAAMRWGSKTSDSVAATADALGKRLQDGTGLYARLRRKAAERIANAWMGDAIDPPSLQAQMLSLIDKTAKEARSLPL